MGSGFAGDWPGGHLPPDPDPYAMDRLKAHARILAAEYGIGWKVTVDMYASGPRLVMEKWPPSRDGLRIVEPTLEAVRQRLAEYTDERGHMTERSFSNGNGPATNGTGGPGPGDLNELWIGASDPRALAMFGLA